MRTPPRLRKRRDPGTMAQHASVGRVRQPVDLRVARRATRDSLGILCSGLLRFSERLPELIHRGDRMRAKTILRYISPRRVSVERILDAALEDGERIVGGADLCLGVLAVLGRSGV